MPTDEEKINLIEAQKREKIEEAIKSNPIFKSVLHVLKQSEYSGIKIDMEKMIDFYMELSGATKLEDLTSFQISDSLVNEVIGNTIHTISEEENGLVIDSNGNIDKAKSLEQAMDGAFNYQSDYAEALLQENQIEQSIIESFSANEEIQEQISFSIESLSESNYEFYKALSENNLTEEVAENHMNETINEEQSEKSIDEKQEHGFISTKEQLELYRMVSMFDAASKEERKEIYKRIKELPQTQKFLNKKTGRIDVKTAIESGRKWRNIYISQKREQLFVQYKNSRKNGVKFSNFSADGRSNMLRAAIRTFEDPESSQDMKAMAIAILSDISPDLIINGEGENDFNFKINWEVAKAAYNGTRTGENVNSTKQIREEFIKEEFKMAASKLDFLQNELEEKGELKTHEKWVNERQVKKKINLSKELQEFDEVLRNDEIAKIVTFDAQDRLGIRIDGTLDSFKNEKTGKAVSATKKVNTVIAAYLFLKKNSKNERLNENERALNEKAYKMLEEHILEDPADYGNYIDDDGIGGKKLKINNDEEFLKAYKSGRENKNTQAIVKEVKKSAREQLLREGDLLDYLSKDAIEILAIEAKDGIKNFIKQGLGYVLGETRSQKLIKKISNNKVYTATKKTVYKSLSGLYHFGKNTKEKLITGKNRKKALPEGTIVSSKKYATNSYSSKKKMGIQNQEQTPVNSVVQEVEGNKFALGSEYVEKTRNAGFEYAQKLARVSEEARKKENSESMAKVTAVVELPDHDEI